MHDYGAFLVDDILGGLVFGTPFLIICGTLLAAMGSFGSQLSSRFQR